MNIERPIVGTLQPPPERTRFSGLSLRRLAMVVVPALVVIAGTTMYLLGGRYVDTDDAYIKADFAEVTPGASGDVAQVLVKENEHVTKGQPLVTLVSDLYRIGAEAADTQLETTRYRIESDRAQYQQKVAQLAMAQTDLEFADRELKRQSTLAKSNNVSQARLDEARHAYDTADQKIAELKQEEAEFLAKLEGKPDQPIEDFAAYKSALANKAMAEYLLSRTTVYAPFDGVVSHLPRVGDYGRTGVPLLNIMVSSHVWVEANFKETELTHVHPGQPAEIQIDTYPGHVFHGHVESIAQASGAEYSLLPAQNTTGNWIKVVQRIAVRIAVDQQANDSLVLRSGMSVDATVDTGRRRIARWLGVD